MLRSNSQTILEVKELMIRGMKISDAIRYLHMNKGVGTLFLWPAIAEIENVSKRDAMRLAIKWTDVVVD